MKNQYERLEAPGAPGIPAKWTSSAKSGIGTAINQNSHVWFTISHGVINEIYYPRVDQACVRDMGLIITDGKDFFSEEKRHAKQEIEMIEEGVPAYRIKNSCYRDRYHIWKEVITDPKRDVVIQQIRFLPAAGEVKKYHLHILLAPHLGNQGANNNGWIGEYKGYPMLFAEREGNALALMCSLPWRKRSAGFVGSSDGWQDLMQHKQLTWEYSSATNGNIALVGEIDLSAAENSGDPFTLILGFGSNYAEAGQRAINSFLDGYELVKSEYIQEWKQWSANIQPLKSSHISSRSKKLYAISAAVIHSHEDKRLPGGLIASLSIPWGSSKGDDDLGGYHLVWPRDLVEVAGGMLASGNWVDTTRILRFLQVTQEEDGHWPQNMWIDGRSYWAGIQMDETAFPILLLDLARRNGALSDEELKRFWPMVRTAAGYLVCNGPVTQQDRWEEDPGYSPFTLAVEIAALLTAAEIAEIFNEDDIAHYLQETADSWNENIENWTYITGTEVARNAGVDGYYVRIAPPEVADSASLAQGFIPIKNRPPGESIEPATAIISPDALALVRFGLRSPEDPRILNTIQVIDHQLKRNFKAGPAWYRYNDDSYGEHDNGDPFDGTGKGRVWPLLTGERAHYELAAGHIRTAKKLLNTFEHFANVGGLFPEQVWDSADIPEKELYKGHPSGSAMPLAWAHAEYIKLLRSLEDGKVFDMPPQTVRRYGKVENKSDFTMWRFNHKIKSLSAGKVFRIEVLDPAIIHWGVNGWKHIQDTPTRDTGLGIHIADLKFDDVKDIENIQWTFLWTKVNRWEGEDFSVNLDR
jgi:glucoamylase